MGWNWMGTKGDGGKDVGWMKRKSEKEHEE